MPKPTKVKGKIVKYENLTPTEKAIIYLAEMIEQETHYNYQSYKLILEILGLKKIKYPKKP